MGMFDYYGDCQIKAGACEMARYRIGDQTDLEDGVYVDYAGVIVIKNRIFIAEFPRLLDKYGEPIDLRELANKRNPVFAVIQEMEKKYEK